MTPQKVYEYYEQATIFQNTNDLYVQQYVIGDEHCWFEDEDVSNAFDNLSPRFLPFCGSIFFIFNHSNISLALCSGEYCIVIL